MVKWAAGLERNPIGLLSIHWLLFGCYVGLLVLPFFLNNLNPPIVLLRVLANVQMIF
jgi:hypothetical protein